MAMNFQPAGRAATPDYTSAYLEQEKIKNQIRQAEQLRRLQYGMAGAQLAGKVPAEKWGALGNSLTGGSTAANLAPGATVVEPASGAVASALPEAAGGYDALFGAIPGSSAAPSAAIGAEAAGVAEGAMAAEAAAGAGAGASGVGPALAGIGPMGWLALLGFGLAATDAFS